MRVPGVPQFILLLVVSLFVAYQDARYYRIPDVLTVGGTALALFLAAVLSLTGESWRPLGSSLVGFVVGFGIFLVVSLLMPGKLGFGDVKYSGFLGACLGPPLWFLATFFSAFAGIVTALLVVVRHRRSGSASEPPSGRLAFGPLMAAGAVAASIGAWAIASLQTVLVTGW